MCVRRTRRQLRADAAANDARLLSVVEKHGPLTRKEIGAHLDMEGAALRRVMERAIARGQIEGTREGLDGRRLGPFVVSGAPAPEGEAAVESDADAWDGHDWPSPTGASRVLDLLLSKRRAGCSVSELRALATSRGWASVRGDIVPAVAVYRRGNRRFYARPAQMDALTPEKREIVEFVALLGSVPGWRVCNQTAASLIRWRILAVDTREDGRHLVPGALFPKGV